MTSAYDAVHETLGIYLDGLYHSDTARLRRAMHSQARYVSATDETLVDLSMDEYFRIVDARPSPASRNEPRRDEIVSIAFAGPKTAVARVHCAIGQKRFTDILTLIRGDRGWQIIAKVFHYDLDR